MARPRSESTSFKEIFTRDFLTIATINLAMFFGFQMTNIGMPVYVAELGATPQVVGLVGTFITVTALVVRVFAGPIIDKFGRKGALVAGCAIMLASLVAYAVFPIVGVILGIRLLHGIGWGLGSNSSSTIAADVIPKERFAEGMGYFALTTAISSALAPAVSVWLVQGPGAQYMIFTAAGCTAVALMLSILHRPRAVAPEAPAAPSGKPQAAACSGSGGSSPIDAIFERRAAVAALLILCVNIGFGSITSFITLHTQEQGIATVTPYFVLYAITTFASRPPIGKVIDKVGYRTPGILATLCTAGTLAVIGFAGNVWMLAVAGVLAGLGIGTAMSVFQSMAVASVEPWRRGVATSTYLIAFDLGIAIGSLVGGFTAQALGYTAMYVVVAVAPLVACVLTALLVKPGEGVGAAR